jgi:hypothetical protein
MDALALIAKQAQACIASVPVIVLGSGASVDYAIPGMPELAKYLAASSFPDSSCDENDKRAWRQFLELAKTKGLEEALSNIQATEHVTNHVVATTWDFLNVKDLEALMSFMERREPLPLTKLFKHLFQSTSREIHVVTPNYDRIAEYAADLGQYCSYNGFTYGTIGHRGQTEQQHVMLKGQRVRTVNVWKVHGSFGWFADTDGVVISLPPMERRPKALRPVIVTPGTEKYRKTHDEPFRSIMQRADEAMRTAPGFLCIGYGFNDTHLQPNLVERCTASGAPLILLTKVISKEAHIFLSSGRCKTYLAIEEDGAGIRAFSQDHPAGIHFDCEPFWKLDTFLTLIA